MRIPISTKVMGLLRIKVHCGVFFLFFFIATLCNSTVYGQSPTQMQYQLRLSKYANQTLSVKMELRQGSMDGETLWSQTTETSADANGTCNLLLDISDGSVWSKSPLYLVASVGGEQIGGSLLTSVPYSMRAASVDGCITKEEIIGTWVENGKSEGESNSISFNTDGTGSYIFVKKSTGADGLPRVVTDSYVFEWILENGILAIKAIQTSVTEDEAEWHVCPIIKTSDSSFLYRLKGAEETIQFNKK